MKKKPKKPVKPAVVIVWKKSRQPETEQPLNEWDRLARHHFADMLGKLAV